MIEYVRKSILQISALQMRTAISEENLEENVEGLSNLDDFLKNENDLILYGVTVSKNNSIEFFKREPDISYEKMIVFSKRHPCVTHENFMKDLHINTILDSPTVALYESLNKVYSPLFKKYKDTNIERKLATLQSNLRNTIISENPQYDGDHQDLNIYSLSYSNSVNEEINYWKSMSQNKTDKLLKRKVEHYVAILSPITKDLSVIEALPLNEVEDLLERCYNALDDLWRQDGHYPKERMKHLMDLIGYDLWKHTIKQLKDCDLFKDEYNQISELLIQSIAIGEKWLSSCKQLTELLWPNYSSNPWKEVEYQPPDFVRFIEQLKEVLKIRTVHKQLLRLSTEEELDDLRNEVVFKPFKDIDILSYDSPIEELPKANKEFEYLLQPAEKRVALKLKKQLVAVNGNFRQLIFEFTRYSELICRPVLKKILQPERQFLLTSLHEYVSQIQSQANAGPSKIVTKQETSDVVKETIFLRQLEAKVSEVTLVTKTLLDDLDGIESVTDFVTGVANDLKVQNTELFESWCSDCVADINSRSLSLNEKDPVVEFSKDKLMKVNYPSRLISLIAEVRQFKAMGYRVPSSIDDTTEHAKRFMKFARILEQVSNFHNTIGSRMVPSQKPMMLSSALELSKMVQEQEVVSWDDEKAVEKYVDILKKAVEKLSRNNNLLTSYHIDIIDKINELEDVSLLKDYPKWKDTMKEIKTVMETVENKGFKNMQSWKSEIDSRIGAVLEEQYVKNLNSLHLNLQEIRVDLVYRSGVLNFSPNHSSLEQMYEQQLKRYLDIPKTFEGVSDDRARVFSDIIEKNAASLENLTKRKNELFDQLESVKKHWQSWLQLDHLDTKKLTSWQHWDLHFRASKTFGQEIAKLPSTEEKVGCFLVGLSRLRSDLESHNRSYWDQLVYSLKDSIAEDVVKLQNYIDPATGALTKQPLSLDELGQSGFDYTNITSSYSEMEIVFNEMVQKSKALSSWSREQVDAVNRIKGAWERLGSLIENHQHIMAKQMETVRTTLDVEKENLLKEVERFEAKWHQLKSIQSSLDLNENSIEGVQKQFKDLQEKKSEWGGILEKKNSLMEHYTKFKLELPDIDFITEVEKNITEEETSWKLFEDFYAEFEDICKEYWIVYRKKLVNFENFIKEWQEKLVPEAVLNYIPPILQELQKYKTIISLLRHVKGDDFSEKHWNDVFDLLGIEPKPVEELLVKDFLNASENIQEHAQELQAINKRAASEIVVRQAMRDIDQWEMRAKFTLISHKDSQGKELHLIKEFKELLNAIGDHQILLQSLKHSADFAVFEDKATSWEKKLETLNTLLHLLNQVQKKWLYLEPIFSRGTLVQEKTRFDRLDRDFRKVMSLVDKDCRITELCRYPDLVLTLQNVLDQLTRCQHSLNDFLKGKRELFPRFLFLSDDDLLEVIGHSREQVIQTHLKKIFAGIHSIQLDQVGENLVSISSAQGEVIHLTRSVSVGIPVEQWLGNLVTEMQATLKSLLISCQRENQAADPLKYPSQILCLSDNISFTSKCEQAINNVTLPTLLAHYKAQLNELSSLDLNLSTNSDNDDILLELKLKALVLDTIHHIAVLEELLNKKITSVSDWSWQKQIRYYLSASGDVTIKIARASMDYAFEYLGNEQKLVKTPLTERCFLTLTQALYLGLGGNPYGPAGTGKTESVKALGSILGRQVLVFNCDEGIDSSSMERILTGLVKTGAWGCFDEFNRLEETTLSSVSMLIQSIQEALKNNLKTMKLGGFEATVNKHCGVFVTLNPAGEGYGGRNKLPDNLKQLFRPVIMTRPDHEQIARTLLYCDGYNNADIIAKKIVEVFEMSSKLMSKQSHYDWGLRAIKTALGGCQMAIKKHKITDKSPLSLNQELCLVVGSLKMDVISKLTAVDSIKFQELLKNVFEDISVENTNEEELTKAIKASFVDLKLIPNEIQVGKCLEFYKQLKQRMGVAIIGPPSSGKSTILKLLEKALSKIHQKIKCYPLNPKSMPRKLLLGHVDHLNQWNDGVLTSYGALVSSESKDTWSWIICDGDLDPEWVESLNSVLDDNRLMTLPSGWRIHFDTNVNFVFETDSLKNASPATISRLGIVYLSENDAVFSDYIKGFLDGLSEEKRNSIGELVSEFFLKAVNWVINDGESTVTRSKLSVARTGLSLVRHSSTKTSFALALINGLGQQLQQDFRELFIQQIFDWLEESPPVDFSAVYYDDRRDIIATYHTDTNAAVEKISEGKLLVITGQVLQYLDVLRVWLEENYSHILLVGPNGTAKRLMLNYITGQRLDIELAIVYCCAYLTPEFVIYQLQQHCFSVNTFKGKVLKPKKGHLILYFNNLHLLKPDKWGTNMLIEFLNQLVEFRGYFDEKTEFVGVENVRIVGSLLPNQKISKRFTSKFYMLNVNSPEKENISIIATACLMDVMKSHFSTLNYPKAKITKVASIMVAIFEKIKCNPIFLLHNHFVISTHDLTLWCYNLGYYPVTEASIPEIICYECLRIFGDKLARDDEKKQLWNVIDDVFRVSWELPDLSQTVSKVFYVAQSDINSKNIIFEKYSKETWLNRVEDAAVQFGKEYYDLNVIINDAIMILTSSLLRASSITSRHMLLIAKAGIGRKTAVKITSILSAARVIQPVTGGTPYFQNDLKIATQRAGLECEDVFLVLEDFIFDSPENCNAVNLLMCSGFIPNLYSTTEMDVLVKGLKEKCDNENFEGDLHQFFANNIKKHLRIFACLDENNERLWKIIQKCPGFLNNSSTLWLNKWDSDTLRVFPVKLLALLDDRGEVECSINFQQIDEHISNSTPSRYISLIKLYFDIYIDKKNAIQSRSQVLTAGISKLTAAKELVEELKVKASEQQEKLAEKQSKANAALDMISNTMKGASEHKEEMEDLKKKTEAENAQLMKRKAEIEEELSEVEPLIQEARSAVGNIKTEALSEIRSLRAPPEIIRDILEGVLRLMGTQDTSWNSMKTFLAKRGVKEEIRSFDASRIQTENRQAVEKLMANKKESFDAKTAKRASVAAAPLAAWVGANVKYSKVLDKIRPLEREQDKLKKNLDNSRSQLGQLSAGLSDVDATVAKLKEQLSMYTKEAAEIEIDLNRATETLQSAENLVFKLEDEYERWQHQLVELSDELQSLQNYSLLSAAFIMFLSEKSDSQRIEIMEKWKQAVGTIKFDFLSFFCTEREQLQWQTEGLAGDKFALENALVIKKGSLTPLITDPTSCAVQWIKTHYGTTNKKNFEFISESSSKFNTILETSVRFGKTLLIEEIEELPHILIPLLRKQIISEGERKMIKILGKQIDYHEDFKLILCSRNEHVKISAELAPYLINLSFNVTYNGFIEQLLSAAIKQEKPELESRKKELLQQNEELQEKLQSLQNQLLESLANYSGNILNDKNLLNTLNETKASSTAVSLALDESRSVQAQLRKEYELYLDISTYGSRLYFACNEFSRFNVLYSLSTEAYTKLFINCLQTVQTINQSLELQNRHLFQSVYNYMARGMFKNDRLAFLMHLIYKMCPIDIPEKEMKIFLNNTLYKSVGDTDSTHIPSWIPPLSSFSFVNLMSSLSELVDKCQMTEGHLWSEFMKSAQCERNFPSHVKLTEFQKVLVVQSLRPDRLLSSIECCLLRLAGLKTVDPPILNLHNVLKESTHYEPILLLTNPGSDPSIEIRELAAQLNRSFEEIAMGSGQESQTLTSLERCANEGKWLILKNLHLLTYWLPTLAQNLKNVRGSHDFRLWLISESTDKFYFVLSYNSLKIAYEEPQGVGNNIQRIYSWLSQKFGKFGPNATRLFFVFTCFHALLQERRNYIPQGWHKFYEFNHTDLQTSLNLTDHYWQSESTNMPWDYIKGLLFEAVYGGRVEVSEDLQILETYLKMYFKGDTLSHKWKPMGLNVNLPNSNQIQDYMNAIRQFPKKDLPSFFGLPENIDKAREKQLSMQLITNLKGFYLKQSNISPSQIKTNYKELSPILSLWRKLNHGQDYIRLSIPEQTPYDSSIETYIAEEYCIGLRLIQTIHKSLTNLNKVAKGTVEPDENDVSIAESLIFLQTPRVWLDIWKGPKDPSSYLRAVLQRMTGISKWNTSNKSELLRKPVDLSFFFYPDAFLASLKQDFSRSGNIPLDNLTLQTKWRQNSNPTVILSGLLIEGGLFENTVLKQCRNDSESVNTAPDCYLNWIEKVKMTDSVTFPLYTNSSREHKITDVQVDCNQNDKDEWILSGLAFYVEY
ncbi:cytoplasmic dynein 2 heavy chain 1 [Sitophilus oryzae]|uniref:Cytoplasmic dynein 2 heavy chain 1 n=1 Tax=Sitophilus oryzae TaxID=7048 RepID=A0A6J2YI60_SITOR|nr:cytoplasmic dynein 2 heavy chain 1 [Sitophilus oryzae]